MFCAFNEVMQNDYSHWLWQQFFGDDRGIIWASVDSYELMMFYQLKPYTGFFQCVHGLTLVEAEPQLVNSYALHC